MRKELSDSFHFIAYCLMPNHFHLLVQVKLPQKSSDDFESSDEYQYSKQISNKIAILLRSYTRAVNIQENRTGSLFQQKTKAKCLNEFENKVNDYIESCFYYIHQNPLNAGLVKRLEDWKFSSFPDYAGFRNGTLCYHQIAKEMINIDQNNFMEQSYAVLDEKNLKRIWV
jgi:putative transposase